MCGIIGYVGRRDVAPVLLESLRRVTYRGYDSFGVALTNGAGIHVYKSTVVIEHRQKEVLGLQGSVGIGHTRWATVGKVSEANAHPPGLCRAVRHYPQRRPGQLPCPEKKSRR
jgi:glucosamine--fructose-6-phosphate aminotransferase (isomerizing)